MIDIKEKKRISMIGLQILEYHPFWGYIFLQMTFVQNTDFDTFAATDCISNIWYNPNYTKHLNNKQLGFVIIHELCHQLFLSKERKRGRNHHIWNCATDYAINRIVLNIENPILYQGSLYQLPDGNYPKIGKINVLFNKKYDNYIAELIYEDLLKNYKTESIIKKITLLNPKNNEKTEIPNIQDHQGGIDIHLPDMLSNDEKEEINNRLAAAVELWEKQDRRGNYPSNLLRNIGITSKKRVPWQRIFQRLVNINISKDEYLLSKPNKKYLLEDIIIPGLYSENPGNIVISLDTSKSMTEKQLSEIGSEIKNLTHYSEDLLLLIADAKVHQIIKTNKINTFLKKGKVKGGGGTDHRPVFNYLKQNKIQTDIFIGISDLYTALPKDKPKFPVIWLTPKKHKTPPWGMVIEIET